MNLRMAISICAALTLIGVAGCSQPSEQPPAAEHGPTATTGAPLTVSAELAGKLSQARAATAKYVTDLDAAQGAGYQIITKMMPGMGFHYLNPSVKGFDVAQPAILVYVKNGDGWQLGALEWVWPEQPAQAPLEGATYGSFDAACHYRVGTFVPAAAQTDCQPTSPDGGSAFGFWHPNLVTLHVWLWHHNPAGLYNPTNPLVHAA